MRRWAPLLAIGSLAAVPISAQVPMCGPALSSLQLPEGVPDTLPTPVSYEPLRVDEVRLGVGHLRPVADGYSWDWQRWLRLPLFDEPDEVASDEPGPEGPVASFWIADGWIVGERQPPRPLQTSGMIETGYETLSLIVLERRADGWLRLRHAPGAEGTAWAHACLLELGRHPLVFESWTDRLTSADVSPLYFISDVPHALRDAPSSEGGHVATIPADQERYQLEPLETRGEWMRVRVTMPRTYCTTPGEIRATVREGWIRWRDADRGSWLWYYTRGC